MKSSTLKLCPAILLLFLSPFLPAQDFSCSYVITHKSENTLSIKVTVVANKLELNELLLPNEWDGEEELYEHIQNIKPISSSLKIVNTDSPYKKKLMGTNKSGVVFQYDLVSDLAKRPIIKSMFNRPYISEKYLYLLGTNFLVFPHFPNTSSGNFTFEFRNFPEDCLFVNSYGVSSKTNYTGTISKVVKSVFAAGSSQYLQYNKEANVVLLGSLKLDVKEISQFLRSVKTLMNTIIPIKNEGFVFFYPMDDYQISGSKGMNSFRMYISKESTDLSMDKKELLAHELFHFLNPGELGTIRDEKLYWFTEGFTDFYANWILYRIKEIDFKELVMNANKIFHRYYISPFLNMTSEEMIVKRRKFPKAQKIPYQQGFITALNWNAKIHKVTEGNANLDDFMRMLYDLRKRVNDEFHEKDIVEAFQKVTGLDISSDIDKIKKGLTLEPVKGAFGENASLKKISISSFDPGFNLEKTFETRIITGVNPDGPAYKAGLRNGQKFKGGGMLKEADKLADINIEIDGKEKNIKYYPASKEKKTIWQFQVVHNKRQKDSPLGAIKK